MTFEALGQLNWLAVVVATIVYFALGAVWYSPGVFGRAWMRASGIEMTADQRPSATFYMAPLVVYLIVVVAMALLAHATGSTTVGHGITLGLVLGLGLGATFWAIATIFGQRPEPRTWFLIQSGYTVLGMLIVAVIVSVWR